MTTHAIVGELTCRVVGALRRLKIGLVAGETLRRRTRELTGRMTGETINRLMRSLKGKVCLSMVECRWLPPVERMTRGAIVRELSLLMVRGHYRSKIGPMTSITICRCSGEFRIDMAGCAIDGQMRSGELEISFPVIKRRGLPCRRRVTGRTVV